MTNKLLFKYNVPITSSAMMPIDGGASEDLVIEGTAINAVETRNGVEFPAEELRLAAPSLIGKVFLKDHENKVDAISGEVMNAYFDADNACVKFTARITSEDVAQKIKKRVLKSVSIGAMIDRAKSELIEKDDGTEILRARGIEFVELSAVAVPADPNANISQAIQCALQTPSHTSPSSHTETPVKTAAVEDEQKNSKERTSTMTDNTSDNDALKQELEQAKQERHALLVEKYQTLAQKKGLKAISCEGLEESAIKVLITQAEAVDDKKEENKDKSTEADAPATTVVDDDADDDDDKGDTVAEQLRAKGVQASFGRNYVELSRADTAMKTKTFAAGVLGFTSRGE